MYISWLDCHPDKMEVVGSSPTITTTFFYQGPILDLTVMHLVKDKQWAYTRNSKKI